MTRVAALLLAPLALALLAGPPAARAQGAQGQAPPTIAILGGTVHVEPGRTIEGGTVLLRDGKVVQVGKDVPVPAGARRIDASGKVVTAGLIAASTRLGLEEVSLEKDTVEGQHESEDDVIHAAYRVADGYNPESVAIPIARKGGITSAVSVPGGGLISGTSALYPLADGATSDDAIASPLAMYVSLGKGALKEAGGSRGAALERLREVLDDARVYSRRKAEFERNQTREFAAERLDLAALGPVLRGQLPLVVRVHRASDIRAALRLRDDVPRLRLIVAGGAEAWTLAEELAEADVPVVLDPTANLPFDFDRVQVRNDAAKVLVEAGVEVAISPLRSASMVRTLRQLAGVAAAYGLSREQALEAITAAPARIFGVQARGVLTQGAAADVVVWSGDPLEVMNAAEHVFIGGVEQSLESRQSRLLERYRRIPISSPGGPGSRSASEPKAE